jgi:thiamine pyrophosphate-dependent acetolactate synthase large subunit-like protein
MQRSQARWVYASSLQTQGSYTAAEFCTLLLMSQRFCNGVPGLATAFADRSPIFCVTSSPPLRDAETNCLQGFHDQVVLAKPITKFVHRVTTVEEIPRLVAYAFHTASSGAPGPVLVDFPVDVLFSPPRLSAISFGAVTRPPARAPAPDPAAVDELLSLWKASSRPAIITGTGARGTGDLLLKLAEKSHTPVFYSTKYSSAIPHGHEHRGGPAGLLAALPAIGKPQADLIILLGARTGFLLGGRSGAVIPNANCKVIQVDVDGVEIGRSHPIDLGIISDATRFLEAVLAQMDRDSDSPFKENGEWTQLASSLKSLPSPHANDPKAQPDGRLHPYHAVQAVMRALPPDSIITVDGGEAGIWAQGALEAAKPHIAMAATGYLGFLGNGWGYALGSAVADPSRLVVNMHGDGSAGFHIAELDTFARHGLRILTVVVNNYAWGMSLAGQEIVYSLKTPARMISKLSPSCRYDVVAQGFGCEGVMVTEYEKIGEAVRGLSEVGKGPGLLNLIVSETPITGVTRSMVDMTEDEDMIVVPYYDNVPRPYYREKGRPDSNENANGKVNEH